MERRRKQRDRGGTGMSRGAVERREIRGEVIMHIG